MQDLIDFLSKHNVTFTIDGENELDEPIDLVDAIVMYRNITGACSGGVEAFLNTYEPKDSYTVNQIIDMTKDNPEFLSYLKSFRGRINTSFGIGTNLTNDLGVKPLQIVKMVECNGNPVAKISDSSGKGMCGDYGHEQFKQFFA